MNRLLKRTITGVRGIPREVQQTNNYSKKAKTFIFLHRMHEGLLCSKSVDWYQYFSKKEYIRTIHFFYVSNFIKPFGVIFYNNNHWLLKEKEQIDKKLKDFN